MTTGTIPDGNPPPSPPPLPPIHTRHREQILFDHWLLVEMRGRDPALTGQKLLVVACGLRARLGALLSGALAEAEKRKRTGGGGSSGGGGGGAQYDQHQQSWPGQGNDADAAAAGGDSPGDGKEVIPQGLLPPLLLKARQAWLEGGQLGGGDDPRRRRVFGEEGGGLGGRRDRRGQQQEQERAGGVDWAQEAEDLSVDLADFMLQSIG